MKKKRLLICIDPYLYKLLANEKNHTGTSMAEIIRRAIKAFFENRLK